MLKRLISRTVNLWRAPPMREFQDYEEYWDNRGRIGSIFERCRVAAELLPEAGSVLDVGCGSGEFLAYLKDRRPGLQLAGVDLAQRSVDMTREAGFDADRVDLLADDLPGRYDYITCFEVLEHIQDAEIVAGKLRDAARRRLIVSIPNVGYIGCRIRLALFGRFPTTRCVMHIKEHIRFWTVRDFRLWADHCGLRVVRVIGVNGMKPFPWRRWPSLFASGVVYVLEPANSATPGADTPKRDASAAEHQ